MKLLSHVLIAISFWISVTAYADEIKEIPIKDCSSARVLVTIDYEAMQRELTVMTARNDAAQKIGTIASKYETKGDPKQPIGELLSSSDAAAFASLSTQSQALSFYELAESRRQRDAQIFLRMKTLAEKELDAGAHPSNESDPDFKLYSYLYALRSIFKGIDHSSAANRTECSLDFAFEHESIAAVEDMVKRLQQSNDVKELLLLRQKYSVPDGADLDISKLTRLERSRAPILKAAADAILRGQSEYQANNNGLRFFADVSQLMYDWQKENILTLGPTSNISEYDKADATRYEKLSAPIQKAVNVWRHMDVDFPSQSTKNAQQIVEAMKNSAP